MPTTEVHPAIYIAVWIFCSGSVILFNKYILHTLEFPFPIFLTTCHLVFATIATRVLERTTNLLTGLKNVEITQTVFYRAILPVGFFFSMSLVFSNNAYLYLSVPFIQMLKATTPVAVLLVGYALRIEKTDYLILAKVSAIVLGVIIASYGEIDFVLIGFVFQVLGIATEATRLVMVQQLLKDYKMDPMVSLYHFAPVCAVMNAVACIVVEGKSLSLEYFNRVGLPILLLNCSVALALNISVVFLIGKTSSLVMCLSGVFKDILLVIVSVMIWTTPVTPLQVFGYGIALIGLVWYKQPDVQVKQLGFAFVTLTVISVLMVASDATIAPADVAIIKSKTP
ncbi:hypothetical protein HK100_001640 [Physocladia obscura]|uniref:Sugar phosphate transporter domain-containing protein n=1 Tax=Physocladia obscura TaxID=109957 RepID=A0AAD5SY29_9FUNG|nr:hypothetical protein HK100_001640 [Physocladia obscura]